MTKSDLLELKKRYKKDSCTFTRMAGCYVDAHRNPVLKWNENFLNLKEEEFYKYLEIAQKSLTGTIGNQLLELPYSPEAEETLGMQHFYMALRESKLKNEALLDRFYELVIEHYSYVGNYLILLFHDAYDVMTKTSDRQSLDDSEEVYEYLLCAICPVSLSKPGLGYIKEENRIGARLRDWVVSTPEHGFLFPTFSDRSADIHHITFFTKNAKNTMPAFIENVLGSTPKLTKVQQKDAFQTILSDALRKEDGACEDILLQVHQVIDQQLQQEDPLQESKPVVTPEDLSSILTKSGVPAAAQKQIQESFEEVFHNDPPTMDTILDAKALLTASNTKEADEIILQVDPEKVSGIHARMVDGQKFLLIPVGEHERAKVNGIHRDL